MRTTRLVAMVVVLKVVAVLALAPLAAHADEPGVTGTYVGIGVGGDGGDGGSSVVTTWVEDMGDTLRLTFLVHRFGTTFSTDAPKPPGDGSGSMAVAVDSAGVSGDGTVTLALAGESATLSASGSGSGFGYEGSATLDSHRRYGGLAAPPVGRQFSDMFNGMLQGPPDDATEADVEEVANSLTDEQPGGDSVLAPAAVTPPTAEPAKAAGVGLGLLALVLLLILA